MKSIKDQENLSQKKILLSIPDITMKIEEMELKILC